MKKVFILSLISMAASVSVSASELVYTPINPSFGGSPLNGSFLLSKAQAQNKHRAPVNEKSYAERFQESLERAYLNRIVREITDLSFGDTCDPSLQVDCEPSLFADDATFVSGEYEIQIVTSGTDSVTVQITHIVTGEITLIEVPRFG